MESRVTPPGDEGRRREEIAMPAIADIAATSVTTAQTFGRFQRAAGAAARGGGSAASTP